MIPKYSLPESYYFKDVLAESKRYTFEPAKPKPDELAFLQSTGGTTGSPKAAMLSHANILANVAQTTPWFGAKLRPGKEAIITALPL